MKARILTAVIGLPIVILLIVFRNTIVFNIAVSVICAVGVYELLHNTGLIKRTELLIPGLVIAAYIPFSCLIHNPVLAYGIPFMLFLLVMIGMMFWHHTENLYSEICIVMMSSVLIPLALGSIVFIREIETKLSLYNIILIFAVAWVCDGGAYFVGRAYGKHKLAPVISPKKTVEGLVGGLLSSMIVNILFTVIYRFIVSAQGMKVSIHVLPMILIILIASVLGTVGDLFASVIKRQCKIKDYGNIFPGHGGVMDRFDSILFTAPFIFASVYLFPILTITA